MTTSTQHIFDLGMQLPPDEREKLANLLLDSLEGPEADEDTELQEEIQRRWDRYESGEEPAHSLEEFQAELQKQIEARKK